MTDIQRDRQIVQIGMNGTETRSLATAMGFFYVDISFPWTGSGWVGSLRGCVYT